MKKENYLKKKKKRRRKFLKQLQIYLQLTSVSKHQVLKKKKFEENTEEDFSPDKEQTKRK